MPEQGDGEVIITMLDIYEKLETIEDRLTSFITWKQAGAGLAGLGTLGGLIFGLFALI
jgi:hypothetical protein